NTGPDPFYATIGVTIAPAVENGQRQLDPALGFQCDAAANSCISGTEYLLDPQGSAQVVNVKLSIPLSVARTTGCKLTSHAHITAPFPFSDSNSALVDDYASTTADLGVDCHPTNLKIDQTAQGCMHNGYSGSDCWLTVTVANTGPGIFNEA